MPRLIASHPDLSHYLNNVLPNFEVSAYFRIWEGILIENTGDRILVYENKGEKRTKVEIIIENSPNWMFLGFPSDLSALSKNLNPGQKDVFSITMRNKLGSSDINLSYNFSHI